MKHRKQLERRTFLQDRFDILIKKQKDGRATFADLTELDFIVNNSKAIREKVLDEMQELNGSSDDGMTIETPVETVNSSPNLLVKIKQYLGKLFTLKYSGTQQSLPVKSATLAF